MANNLKQYNTICGKKVGLGLLYTPYTGGKELVFNLTDIPGCQFCTLCTSVIGIPFMCYCLLKRTNNVLCLAII